MKNNQAYTNHISRLFVRLTEKRQLIVAIGAVVSLAACDGNKPRSSDIEPYVTNALGQCQLWTISDVRKVDGIEEGKSYRVDFTATLAMRQTPDQAFQSYLQHKMDPSWMGCHVYVSNLAIVSASGKTAEFSKKYEVSGFGMLIKSENGWRLIGDDLHFEFAAVPESASSASPTPPSLPALANNAEVSPQQSIISTTAPEPASIVTPLSTCVTNKMSAWEKKHDAEIALAEKEAQAKGEELRISAGQEELAKQEVLDKATADCR
jgi:hypothetical protein